MVTSLVPKSFMTSSPSWKCTKIFENPRRKRKSWNFRKYKFTRIFAGSIISISLFFNLIFIVNNQSLFETKISRINNKLRAAVMLACKIDLEVDQKAVSFEWEEDLKAMLFILSSVYLLNQKSQNRMSS